MGVQTFRIPRWNDRQVLEIMREIVSDFSFSEAKLYCIPFEGASAIDIQLSQYEQNTDLVSLLDLKGSSIYHFRLIANNAVLFHVRRDGKYLFDEVSYNWDEARGHVQESMYARFTNVLRQKYKEMKIGETFSGFPNEEIDKYYEAQSATVAKLQDINTELLFGIHKRQHELDEAYNKKIQELELKMENQRKTLQTEYEEKDRKLQEKEEAFKKKEEQFETSESKYTRRKLRQDILSRLAELSQKFELTKGTKHLRYPVTGFALVFIVFFAGLTIAALTQSLNLIEAAGKDLSQLNWWVLGILSLKQIAFASAFLGGAWFLIKWNDRWFRQHADAEFNFKQLELDINRASWVVEMALEWKEEKGTELPPELLDRLTKNLFKDVSQASTDADNPPDMASLLIGSASNVKFKAGNGTEVELDRGGIKKALNNGR
jgi:hypothetical protein